VPKVPIMTDVGASTLSTLASSLVDSFPSPYGSFELTQQHNK